MYLKSIEIQGFKSFANKIEFRFHNGITAIVGPNGSGKSNVADAVRWVLGEQKVRQLRGSSMQDVIFAGTELRRPLGFAYVAITLDNSDHVLPVSYDEVTVARRLYRSGESEYLLNGTPCRLRDINEIFYDTGIGKEGYSIIGQGQIDRILSDKPEDRRELFDEAAGIVKFKRRKLQSLKRLDSEKENLARIFDILSVLEKRVGPLEEQARTARIYLDAREQMKAREINVFLIDHKAGMDRLADLDRRLSIAEGDLAQARESYEEAGRTYQALETEAAGLDKKIEEARNRITDSGITAERLEADIKIYEEQISSARQNAGHFIGRRDQVKADIEKRRQELEEILTRKAGMDAELAALEADRDRAREALEAIQAETRSLEDQLEEARTRILSLISERGTIRSRKAGYSASLEQSRIRIGELDARMQDAHESQTLQEEKISRLQEEFGTLGDRVRALRDEQTRIREALAGKKQELTEADGRLQKKNEEFHRERSRLEALRDLAQRHEGFGGAVRRVMDAMGSDPDIHGVTADLITTDRKYETAVETAIGGAIQNIVVDNEDTAGRIIRYLKKEKAGRVTCMPLTAAERARGLSDRRILSEPGMIDTADNLVRTDPRFRAIARYYLGRTVVADTYAHARDAFIKYDRSVRMVTLEGELLNPGGAISGGFIKGKSALLGRSREIGELEERTRALTGQIEAVNAEIEEIKRSRNLLRDQDEDMNRQIQSAILALNTARTNIINEKNRQKEATGSREELLKEKADLTAEAAGLTGLMEEADVLLAASVKEEEALTARIGAMEERQDALRFEEEDASAELADRQRMLDRRTQEGGFEQINADRLTGEISAFEKELTDLDQAVLEADAGIEEKKKLIAQARKDLEACGVSRDRFREDLRGLNGQKEVLAGRMKRCLGERDTLAERIGLLDKEGVRLTSMRERAQEAIDSSVAYMWNEYGITMSEAAALRDPSLTDPAQLRKEAAALKKKIRDLGPVNVGAIEEYRELMEEYTFKKQQYDDLVDATGKLESIIEELDASMRRQFRDQFGRIQSEFDRVFRQLFGGGSGRLELMEDVDILEAGVRVIAQPPGKKLQNMMQLSGGEKALTAIALLFAIQNLKPSPFCLLDEIEAALDESNVTRLSGYLHKLTAHTQFIVITHRRGTMEEADRLYGITMQEKGVSALVSVSLVDKDLDP